MTEAQIRRTGAALPRTPSEEERLGIRTGTPSATLIAQLGLEKDQGITVERVEAESAAAKAGLKAGDVLIKIDGKPVPSERNGFKKLLGEVKPDSPVQAVVLRRGKEQSISGLVIPSKVTPVEKKPAERKTPEKPGDKPDATKPDGR